jgi:hypothetical protein
MEHPFSSLSLPADREVQKHKIVIQCKTRTAGLSMQFGTDVKSGTYETFSAGKEDFAANALFEEYLA